MKILILGLIGLSMCYAAGQQGESNGGGSGPGSAPPTPSPANTNVGNYAASKETAAAATDQPHPHTIPGTTQTEPKDQRDQPAAKEDHPGIPKRE